MLKEPRKITPLKDLMDAGMSIKEMRDFRKAERAEAIKHMKTAFGFELSGFEAEQAYDRYVRVSGSFPMRLYVDPMTAAYNTIIAMRSA